ncbi:MAG: hypothetical protein IT539_03335 [Bradyrhizobiaceae bacterium]|nr:hypothetical protein [Bradyrhizobiaceae bacterium]
MRRDNTHRPPHLRLANNAMRIGLLAILSLALASPCLAEADPPLLDHAAQHAGQDAQETERELTPQEIEALAGLFPEGAPNLLAPESFTRKYRLPAGVQPNDIPKPLPTALDYTDGPVKFGMKTKVAPTTQTPSVIPAIPDPKIVGGAAGGTGEVNGQITYSAEGWELYGGRTVGVAQPDGASPTLSERTMLGSSFKLPDWLAGGKLNTSVEFADTNENKTRVEYRQPLGPAEGFIAAEQQFQRGQFDPKQPPASVRGGVTRKF